MEDSGLLNQERRTNGLKEDECLLLLLCLADDRRRIDSRNVHTITGHTQRTTRL